MVSIQGLLNLLDSLSGGSRASLNCLEVNDCGLVEVVKLPLVPVCFGIAEILFLRCTLSVNNGNVVFEILKGKIKLKIVRLLLLRGGRHRIVRIVQRSKSLMHGLRWWPNRL